MPVRTPRHRIDSKTSAKSSEIDRILANVASKYVGVDAEDLKHLIAPIVKNYEGNDATELERIIVNAIDSAGYERVKSGIGKNEGHLSGVFTGDLGNFGAVFGQFGNLGRNLLKIKNMGTWDQYFTDDEGESEQDSGYTPPVIEIPTKPYQPPVVEEPEPVYPPVEGPGGEYVPYPPIDEGPDNGYYPEPVGPAPAYGVYTGHDLTYRQGKKVSQGKRVNLGPGAKRVLLPRIEGYGYQNTPRRRLGHVQFEYEGETPVFDAYGDWVDNGRTGMVGQPTWVLAHRAGGKFPVFRKVR